MSQVLQVPPPPIGPPKGDLNLRRVMFAIVFILGLVLLLELRLVNSAAGKEAAQRIRQNARVEGDFGNDVHLPFAVGWDSGAQGKIYAWVKGSHASGYAEVELRKQGGDWVTVGLDVHNGTEDHLISLATPAVPARREQLQGSGTLYFVALGDGADRDVADLESFFQSEFGISAKTLPPMRLPAEAYDSRRKQWIAEMLVQAMRAKYPEVAADPDARIVGILEDDLYIYSFNWNYTYSYRSYDKISVVPTVRLDPAYYRLPPDAAIRMERLRKVAMKAVGLLYLGFKESSQPQSVDSGENTIRDIDRMGSVYLESDVRTRALTKFGQDGTPCLTFFSSTLAGAALRDPVVPCEQQGDSEESTRFQIDLTHGRFQLVRNELYRAGVMPLLLQRMNFSYRFDDKVRAFGRASWQNLDDTVWSADPNSIQTINIYGTQFKRITPGTGFSPQAIYAAEENSSDFSRALLSWENGGWKIETRSGEVWRYLGCSAASRVPCYYMGQKNFRGDSVEVRRDPATGHIQQVLQETNSGLPAIAALDHRWEATYDGEKINEIQDSDGRTAHYRYDSQEYLTDVEADGHAIHYGYDDAHRITGVLEDGKAARIGYDSEGRPDEVELPNGTAYTIKYAQDGITVNGPGAGYTVTVMPTYFRISRHAE